MENINGNFISGNDPSGMVQTLTGPQPYTLGESLARVGETVKKSGNLYVNFCSDLICGLDHYISRLAEERPFLSSGKIFMPSQNLDPFDSDDILAQKGYVRINEEEAKSILQAFSKIVDDGSVVISDNRGYQYPFSMVGTSTDPFDYVRYKPIGTVATLIKQQDAAGSALNLLCGVQKLSTSGSYCEYYLSTYPQALIKENGSVILNDIGYTEYEYEHWSTEDNPLINDMSAYLEFIRDELIAPSDRSSSYLNDLNAYFHLGLTGPITDYVILNRLVDQGFITSDDDNLTKCKQLYDLSHQVLNCEVPATTLYSLVKNVSSTGSFNSVLGDVLCQFKDGGSDACTNIISILSEAVTNFANGFVKSDAYVATLDMLNAFKGGPASGVTYLVNLLRSTANPVVIEADQKVTFTNNAIYVPKVVFSGIINAAVTGVQFIGAAIVNYILPGLGFIAYASAEVVKTIVSAIISIASAPVNSAYDECASVFCCPYAMLQFSVGISTLNSYSSDTCDALLTNGFIIIPGLCWRVFAWIDGTSDNLLANFEVHATLVDPSFYLSHFHSTIRSWITQYSGIGGKMKMTIPSADFLEMIQEFAENEVGNVEAVRARLLTATNGSTLDGYIREAYACAEIIVFLCFYGPLSTYQSNFILEPYNGGDVTLPIWGDACENLNTWLGYLKTANTSAGILHSRTWTQLNPDDYRYDSFILSQRAADDLNVSTKRWSIGPGISYTYWQWYMYTMLSPMKYPYSDPDWPLWYPVTTDVSYGILLPEYDKQSYYLSLVLGAVTVAAITAGAVATAITVRKKVDTWNAKWRGKAEQAWYAYTDDPSDENYLAYRKAAKQNNFFTKLTGGTNLNTASYWDDAQTTASLSSLFPTEEERTAAENSDDNLTKTTEVKDDVDAVEGLLDTLRHELYSLIGKEFPTE